MFPNISIQPSTIFPLIGLFGARKLNLRTIVQHRGGFDQKIGKFGINFEYD
jgi:hypothetical protein